MLIGFRIVQAIPGGVLPVITMAALYQSVPRAKIGTALGMYGLGAVVARPWARAGGWLVR